MKVLVVDEEEAEKDRRFCRIDPIRVRTGGRYLYSAG